MPTKAIFKIPEGSVINLFLLLVMNKTGVPVHYTWVPPFFVELWRKPCRNLALILPVICFFSCMLYVFGIIGIQRDDKHN